MIGGVRYVQWPLGYPHESRRRRSIAGGGGWEPCLLWDSQEGASAQRRTYWSDFYRDNERRPDITEPAPWVAG